jgi:hypothetical protein
VLLGEITGGYRLNPFNSRFRRFFLFALAVQLIFSALFFVSQNFPPPFRYGKGIVILLAFVCSAVAIVRLLAIFPAIAVDAPYVSWRNALRDSKGYGWSIFLVLLLITLPLVALTMAVAVMLALVIGLMGKVTIILLIADFLLRPISMVALLAADAAAASRIYRILGNHLGPFPGATLAPAPA